MKQVTQIVVSEVDEDVYSAKVSYAEEVSQGAKKGTIAEAIEDAVNEHEHVDDLYGQLGWESVE